MKKFILFLTVTFCMAVMANATKASPPEPRQKWHPIATAIIPATTVATTTDKAEGTQTTWEDLAIPKERQGDLLMMMVNTSPMSTAKPTDAWATQPQSLFSFSNKHENKQWLIHTDPNTTTKPTDAWNIATQVAEKGLLNELEEETDAWNHALLLT